MKAKERSQDFPIITLQLYDAMKTKVLIQIGQNPNAAFPIPK